MTQIEESVEVDVPVSVAFDQWTRFDEFPQFMQGVVGIQQRTPELTHWVVRLAGVEREFDAQITELIPDDRVAWTTVAGDLKQAGVVTFHRLTDVSTKVMLQIDTSPHGVLETVGEALGFVQRKAIDGLREFKEHVEAHAQQPGGVDGLSE